MIIVFNAPKGTDRFLKLHSCINKKTSFQDYGIEPGTYSYRVITGNGGGGYSDFSNVSYVYVEDTGGYENFDLLYPNPTDGMLHIKLEEPLYNVDLTVVNSLGAILKKFNFLF